MTFTTSNQVDTYTATLEAGNATAESAAFDPSYDNATIINNNLYNHTASGSKSQRLSGANTDEIVGLARSLSVMPGDTVNIKVFGKYYTPTNTNSNAASAMLASIAQAFGVSALSNGEALTAYNRLNEMFGSGFFLGSEDWEDEDAPKAFLNYILFDKDFVPYDMGFDQIDESALETGSNVAHDELQLTALVTQPGYIYIYLSNENEKLVDVYFDDLMIEHKLSPVVQQDDYYAFGLAFNSYTRENAVANNYLYNGFEKQDELDLGWYDYLARQYDPAIGRFMSVDPAADLMRRISPYAYAFNNPVRFTDPDGMVPGDFLNEKGEKVGDDGRKDGKVYVIKTTKSEFDSGVPSAGITKYQAKQTEAYIKENSGNTAAFGEGNIANTNSVEIEGSTTARQGMVDEAYRDNGKGGTSDANNREYGGDTSTEGVFTAAPPGPVADPSVDSEAHIDIPDYGEDTKSRSHDHPSGTKSVTVRGPANSIGTDVTTDYSFKQAPSPTDVSNSGTNVNYVHGRGNGTTYIYNSKGVVATVPTKYFVTPKK